MMRADLTFRAPVGSIDIPAFSDHGVAYEIHPCTDCLPWHAEAAIDPRTLEVLIREWHAIGCPTFGELLAP